MKSPIKSQPRAVLAAMSLFLSAPGGSHAAVPWEAPGVPPPGFPHFEAPAVDISMKRSGAGFQLAAAHSYLGTTAGAGDKIVFWASPTRSFDVYNPVFTLAAKFDAKGLLVADPGNRVTIQGRIPGWDAALGAASYGGPDVSQGAGVLFSAGITSFGIDPVADGSPASIGFTTDGGTFQGWAKQFSDGSDESVYLYNFPVTAFQNSFGSAGFFKGAWKGSAVTTVPVPAAIWLLGSALGAGLLFGRRGVVASGKPWPPARS